MKPESFEYSDVREEFWKYRNKGSININTHVTIAAILFAACLICKCIKENKEKI